MQHKSCAFQRQKNEHNKKRMIGLNLDEDYECITLLNLLVKEKKPDDVEDTRLMTQLLQHPDVDSDDEMWVCPNLLRGIKNKHQLKHEDENNPEVRGKLR